MTDHPETPAAVLAAAQARHAASTPGTWVVKRTPGSWPLVTLADGSSGVAIRTYGHIDQDENADLEFIAAAHQDDVADLVGGVGLHPDVDPPRSPWQDVWGRMLSTAPTARRMWPSLAR